jgi:hypothetical protein
MASLSCFALSAIALGVALQIADGFYNPAALAWLTAALVLAAAAVATLRENVELGRHAEVSVHVVIAIGLAWQIAALLVAAPGMYLRPRASLDLFRAGILAEAAVIGVGVTAFRMFRSSWFPTLLAFHAALCIWMVNASPHPRIDVIVVHRAAFEALLSGRNPYAITFENIYGPDSGFYSPDALAGDRVMFGYPYPPLSLLFTLPWHLVLGDYRYAHAFASTAAAGLIGYIRPGVLPKLAAALLITHPRGFFVLEQGWTEPVAVLCLAASVFVMARRGATAGWLSGALVVTKQYLALAIVPLARFSLGRRSTAWHLASAGAVAAALTIPFLVWNPRAFVDHVFLLQTREPFRIDSLSYLSLAARHGWGAGSFLWAAAAGVIALALAIRATPNTASGFAATLALSTFASFAFGSKAFCNYYYFVGAALTCTLASISPRPAKPPAPQLTATSAGADVGTPCGVSGDRSASSGATSAPKTLSRRFRGSPRAHRHRDGLARQ